jgi:hypothetical protein
MLLVPRWEENDDDDVIVRLCDALLLVLGPLGNDEDVRDYVPQVGVYLRKYRNVVPRRERHMLRESRVNCRSDRMRRWSSLVQGRHVYSSAGFCGALWTDSSHSVDGSSMNLMVMGHSVYRGVALPASLRRSI